jgi:aldose 1-epimerase
MILTRIELAAGEAAAVIAPEWGGMLTSLRVAGQELLVQPREAPEPVPTFGSFLMAPWVGELAFGRISFGGRHARIPPNKGRHAIHGLVASRSWDVVETSSAAARLECRLAPPWPFGGSVSQEFSIDARGITLAAEVRAEREALPAALGWHPWFACPNPEATRLTVDAGHRLELDSELLPTGVVLPVDRDSDLRGAPVLGARQLDTVYVGAVGPAVLETPAIRLEIHSDPAISIVVVYTSPGAVCVEPWSAWPDALRMAAAGHASGITLLEPGESLRRWTRWTW